MIKFDKKLMLIDWGPKYCLSSFCDTEARD